MKIARILFPLLLSPLLGRAARVGKLPAGPLTPQIAAAVAAEVRGFSDPSYEASRLLPVLGALKPYAGFSMDAKNSWQPVLGELSEAASRLLRRADGINAAEAQDELLELMEKLEIIGWHLPQEISGGRLGAESDVAAAGLRRRLSPESQARLKAKMDSMAQSLLAHAFLADITAAQEPVVAKDSPNPAPPLPKSLASAKENPAPVPAPAALKTASEYEPVDFPTMERLARGYHAWIGWRGGSVDDMEFLQDRWAKKFETQGYLVASIKSNRLFSTVFLDLVPVNGGAAVRLGRKLFFSEAKAREYYAGFPKARVPEPNLVKVRFKVSMNPFRLAHAPFAVKSFIDARPPKDDRRGIEAMIFSLTLAAALWPSAAHAAGLLEAAGFAASAVKTGIGVGTIFLILQLLWALKKRRFKKVLLIIIIQKVAAWLIRRLRRA